MTDYNNTFDGRGKLSSEDQILGIDYDTEFDNIQTSIASKTEKITTPVAGDFAQEASGGKLAGSTIDSTYFDTLSSNLQTQIDGKISKAAQATDHRRGGNVQIVNTDTTPVDLSGITNGTEYSVGPTGAGADFTMADLDNVPSTARFIYLWIEFDFIFLSADPTGFFPIYLMMTSGDLTPPTTTTNKNSVLLFAQSVNPGSGVDCSISRSATVLVPCNSSGVYKFVDAGTSDGYYTQFDVHYRGFIG